MVLSVLVSQMITGCSALRDRDADDRSKSAASSFIITPGRYYSSEKAKHLGRTYQKNLERLVKEIAENDITGSLKLANNIDTLGGIGFFTHSASSVPDERYLEVAVSLPEPMNPSEDIRSSIDRVFAKYGQSLLGILLDDSAIYADERVVGYGLNLSWRTASGQRAKSQKVVIYLPKQKALELLRNRITQDQALAEAVIFESEDEKPATRYYYAEASPRG